MPVWPLPAVNKPCYVITAPKHRFTGGSMVNRIIGVCLCLRLLPVCGALWLCLPCLFLSAYADGAARPAPWLPGSPAACPISSPLCPLLGPHATPHAVRAALQGGWALSPSPCTAWT
jgi:hypothetical protein